MRSSCRVWRGQNTPVAIDMSVVYDRAVRLGLPQAVVIVDRFHLLKKANDMLDAANATATAATDLICGHTTVPRSILRK
jgi:transposase